MSKKGKVCVFKSYCVPILTYGAEAWTWTKADISRLTAAETQFLRNTEGKTTTDRIRNKKIRT
jgi:hypothetical protein